MGLDSVGIDIYNIHRYFHELMVGQRTLEFWGVIVWYQSLGLRTPRAWQAWSRSLHLWCISCFVLNVLHDCVLCELYTMYVGKDEH